MKPGGSAQTSRRKFFSAAAAASAAATAFHTTHPQSANAAVTNPSERLRKSQAMRVERAAYQASMPEPAHPTNGDEARYPNKINSFTKTLQHTPIGEVVPASYDSLIRATDSGRYEDFEAILRGGPVRLKNPAGAYTFQYLGGDQSQLTMPAAPRFDSAQQAGEMVELYWQALLRDVAFTEYAGNEMVAAACDDLNKLTDFRGPRQNGAVTPATLFRGNFPGALSGPWVSQFLLQPFKMGSVPVDPKQLPLPVGADHMTSWSSWFAIEIGENKGAGNHPESTPLYIHTGRNIAEFVRVDWSYSPYNHALWNLLAYGPDAFTETNPYVWSRGQEPYINFGPPDAFDFLARAAKPAFHAAWWQKWMIHRRARPEEFGGRVHQNLEKVTTYPIHAEVMQSKGLEATRSKWGTGLLPQAYTEGCPGHSAYPSGHATVAGATITMLKAFFRGNYVIPDPVMPSPDGTRLIPYTGPPLTVEGELNKMGFNIGMGRNFAGIHWRTDLEEGLKLGEEVATRILRDIAAGYDMDFGAFEFNRFGGDKAVVGATV